MLAGLATDPLLAKIQAIAAEHPTAYSPDVPAECTGAAEAEVGVIDPIPAETSALPEGVYRVELTAADVEGAGVSNGPGW